MVAIKYRVKENEFEVYVGRWASRWWSGESTKERSSRYADLEVVHKDKVESSQRRTDGEPDLENDGNDSKKEWSFKKVLINLMWRNSIWQSLRTNTLSNGPKEKSESAHRRFGGEAILVNRGNHTTNLQSPPELPCQPILRRGFISHASINAEHSGLSKSNALPRENYNSNLTYEKVQASEISGELFNETFAKVR